MKKSTRRGFIYFRYILPLITPIVIMLLMLVPCYKFVTADVGLHKGISAWGLISNSWNTVREYLFGTGEQARLTADFAGSVLAVLLVSFLLFAIGIAAAIYVAVSAFRYFGSGERDSKAHVLFITLIPNRIVFCVLYALILPLAFFPRILPLLYDNVLHYHVELLCEPFDIIIVIALLFAATVAAVAVSAVLEKREHMNVFAKHKPKAFEENDGDIAEQEEPQEDTFGMMDRKTREEQNERILKLLNKQEKE